MDGQSVRTAKVSARCPGIQGCTIFFEILETIGDMVSDAGRRGPTDRAVASAVQLFGRCSFLAARCGGMEGFTIFLKLSRKMLKLGLAAHKSVVVE